MGVQEAAWALEAGASPAVSALSISSQTFWNKKLALDPVRAQVVDAYPVSGAARRIFIVQDAHANLSAQKNAAYALDRIFASVSGTRSVYLEAGFSDESFDEVRRRITPERRRETAERLIKKGELQGSQYFHLVSPQESRLIGVEDPAHYAAAWEAFRRMDLRRARLERFAVRLGQAADAAAARIFDPERRALWKEVFGGPRDLTADAKLLARAAARGAIEDRWPQITRWTREARREPADRARLAVEFGEAARLLGDDAADELRSDPAAGAFASAAVFEELRRRLAEKKLWKAAASKYPEVARAARSARMALRFDAAEWDREREDLERTVFAAGQNGTAGLDVWEARRWADRLLRAARLELTGDEAADALGRGAERRLAELSGIVNRALADRAAAPERAVFLDRSAASALAVAGDFYRTAAARDAVMARRILDRMDAGSERTSAVVAGGYHARGLSAALRAAGAEVVVVRPAVWYGTDLDRYRRQILSQFGKQDFKTWAASALSGRPSALMALRVGPARDRVLAEFGLSSDLAPVRAAARLPDRTGPIRPVVITTPEAAEAARVQLFAWFDRLSRTVDPLFGRTVGYYSGVAGLTPAFDENSWERWIDEISSGTRSLILLADGRGEVYGITELKIDPEDPARLAIASMFMDQRLRGRGQRGMLTAILDHAREARRTRGIRSLAWEANHLSFGYEYALAGSQLKLTVTGNTFIADLDPAAFDKTVRERQRRISRKLRDRLHRVASTMRSIESAQYFYGEATSDPGVDRIRSLSVENGWLGKVVIDGLQYPNDLVLHQLAYSAGSWLAKKERGGRIRIGEKLIAEGRPFLLEDWLEESPHDLEAGARMASSRPASKWTDPADKKVASGAVAGLNLIRTRASYRDSIFRREVERMARVPVPGLMNLLAHFGSAADDTQIREIASEVRAAESLLERSGPGQAALIALSTLVPVADRLRPLEKARQIQEVDGLMGFQAGNALELPAGLALIETKEVDKGDPERLTADFRRKQLDGYRAAAGWIQRRDPSLEPFVLFVVVGRKFQDEGPVLVSEADGLRVYRMTMGMDVLEADPSSQTVDAERSPEAIGPQWINTSTRSGGALWIDQADLASLGGIRGARLSAEAIRFAADTGADPKMWRWALPGILYISSAYRDRASKVLGVPAANIENDPGFIELMRLTRESAAHSAAQMILTELGPGDELPNLTKIQRFVISAVDDASPKGAESFGVPAVFQSRANEFNRNVRDILERELSRESIARATDASASEVAGPAGITSPIGTGTEAKDAPKAADASKVMVFLTADPIREAERLGLNEVSILMLARKLVETPGQAEAYADLLKRHAAAGRIPASVQAWSEAAGSARRSIEAGDGRDRAAAVRALRRLQSLDAILDAIGTLERSSEGSVSEVKSLIQTAIDTYDTRARAVPRIGSDAAAASSADDHVKDALGRQFASEDPDAMDHPDLMYHIRLNASGKYEFRVNMGEGRPKVRRSFETGWKPSGIEADQGGVPAVFRRRFDAEAGYHEFEFSRRDASGRTVRRVYRIARDKTGRPVRSADGGIAIELVRDGEKNMDRKDADWIAPSVTLGGGSSFEGVVRVTYGGAKDPGGDWTAKAPGEQQVHFSLGMRPGSLAAVARAHQSAEPDAAPEWLYSFVQLEEDGAPASDAKIRTFRLVRRDDVRSRISSELIDPVQRAESDLREKVLDHVLAADPSDPGIGAFEGLVFRVSGTRREFKDKAKGVRAIFDYLEPGIYLVDREWDEAHREWYYPVRRIEQDGFPAPDTPVRYYRLRREGELSPVKSASGRIGRPDTRLGWPIKGTSRAVQKENALVVFDPSASASPASGGARLTGPPDTDDVSAWFRYFKQYQESDAGAVWWTTDLPEDWMPASLDRKLALAEKLTQHPNVIRAMLRAAVDPSSAEVRLSVERSLEVLGWLFLLPQTYEFTQEDLEPLLDPRLLGAPRSGERSEALLEELIDHVWEPLFFRQPWLFDEAFVTRFWDRYRSASNVDPLVFYSGMRRTPSRRKAGVSALVRITGRLETRGIGDDLITLGTFAESALDLGKVPVPVTRHDFLFDPMYRESKHSDRSLENADTVHLDLGSGTAKFGGPRSSRPEQYTPMPHKGASPHYGRMFRMLAMAGVPFSHGLLNRGRVILGPDRHPSDERLAAEAWWNRWVTDANTRNRPVAALNPFGGETERKGYSSRRASDVVMLNRQLRSLIEQGFFVVILPNHRRWGSEDTVSEILGSDPWLSAREGIDYRVAPAPTGERKTLHKYIAGFSDIVVTVEGGMMHLAYALGKPMLVLPFSSIPERWFPISASQGQGFIRTDEMAGPAAARVLARVPEWRRRMSVSGARMTDTAEYLGETRYLRVRIPSWLELLRALVAGYVGRRTEGFAVAMGLERERFLRIVEEVFAEGPLELVLARDVWGFYPVFEGWQARWEEAWLREADEAGDADIRSRRLEMASIFSLPGSLTAERVNREYERIYIEGRLEDYRKRNVSAGRPDAPLPAIAKVGIPFNGERIPAHLVLPPSTDPASKFPVVVIYHGFTNRKESAYYDELEQLLIERGIAVLRPDLLRHGESLTPFDKPRVRMAEYNRAVVDYVGGHARLLGDRIGVYGFSFGGHLAIRAKTDPRLSGRVRAIAVLNPPIYQSFTDLLAIIRKHGSFLRHLHSIQEPRAMWRKTRALGLSRAKLLKQLSELDHRDGVRAFFGGKDRIISPQDRAFFRQALERGAGVCKIYPDQEHVFTDALDQVYRESADFFAEKLKAPDPKEAAARSARKDRAILRGLGRAAIGPGADTRPVDSKIVIGLRASEVWPDGYRPVGFAASETRPHGTLIADWRDGAPADRTAPVGFGAGTAAGWRSASEDPALEGRVWMRVSLSRSAANRVRFFITGSPPAPADEADSAKRFAAALRTMVSALAITMPPDDLQRVEVELLDRVQRQILGFEESEFGGPGAAANYSRTVRELMARSSWVASAATHPERLGLGSAADLNGETDPAGSVSAARMAPLRDDPAVTIGRTVDRVRVYRLTGSKEEPDAAEKLYADRSAPRPWWSFPRLLALAGMAVTVIIWFKSGRSFPIFRGVLAAGALFGAIGLLLTVPDALRRAREVRGLEASLRRLAASLKQMPADGRERAAAIAEASGLIEKIEMGLDRAGLDGSGIEALGDWLADENRSAADHERAVQRLSDELKIGPGQVADIWRVITGEQKLPRLKNAAAWSEKMDRVHQGWIETADGRTERFFTKRSELRGPNWREGLLQEAALLRDVAEAVASGGIPDLAVPASGVLETPDDPILVMSKARGVPLSDIKPRFSRPVPEALQTRALASFGRALGQLHRLGIRHGDLANDGGFRPDHVFYDAATDRTELIDYGQSSRADLKRLYVLDGEVGTILEQMLRWPQEFSTPAIEAFRTSYLDTRNAGARMSGEYVLRTDAGWKEAAREGDWRIYDGLDWVREGGPADQAALRQMRLVKALARIHHDATGSRKDKERFLDRAVDPKSGRLKPRATSYMENALKDIRSALLGGQVLLAADPSGEVVGFLVLQPDRSAGLIERKIEAFYVLPSSQKSGAGRALLNTAVRRSLEANAVYLHWNTSATGYAFYVHYLSSRWPFAYEPREAYFTVYLGFDEVLATFPERYAPLFDAQRRYRDQVRSQGEAALIRRPAFDAMDWLRDHPATGARLGEAAVVRPLDTLEAERILVYHEGAVNVGQDFMDVYPMLAGLRRRYPDARLALITDQPQLFDGLVKDLLIFRPNYSKRIEKATPANKAAESSADAAEIFRGSDLAVVISKHADPTLPSVPGQYRIFMPLVANSLPVTNTPKGFFGDAPAWPSVDPGFGSGRVPVAGQERYYGPEMGGDGGPIVAYQEVRDVWKRVRTTYGALGLPMEDLTVSEERDPGPISHHALIAQGIYFSSRIQDASAVSAFKQMSARLRDPAEAAAPILINIMGATQYPTMTDRQWAAVVADLYDASPDRPILFTGFSMSGWWKSNQLGREMKIKQMAAAEIHRRHPQLTAAPPIAVVPANGGENSQHTLLTLVRKLGGHIMSIDTGFAHIASVYGIPMTVIQGPQNSDAWLPKGEHILRTTPEELVPSVRPSAVAADASLGARMTESLSVLLERASSRGYGPEAVTLQAAVDPDRAETGEEEHQFFLTLLQGSEGHYDFKLGHATSSNTYMNGTYDSIHRVLKIDMALVDLGLRGRGLYSAMKGWAAGSADVVLSVIRDPFTGDVPPGGVASDQNWILNRVHQARRLPGFRHYVIADPSNDTLADRAVLVSLRNETAEASLRAWSRENVGSGLIADAIEQDLLPMLGPETLDESAGATARLSEGPARLHWAQEAAPLVLRADERTAGARIAFYSSDEGLRVYRIRPAASGAGRAPADRHEDVWNVSEQIAAEGSLIDAAGHLAPFLPAEGFRVRSDSAQLLKNVPAVQRAAAAAELEKLTRRLNAEWGVRWTWTDRPGGLTSDPVLPGEAVPVIDFWDTTAARPAGNGFHVPYFYRQDDERMMPIVGMALLAGLVISGERSAASRLWKRLSAGGQVSEAALTLLDAWSDRRDWDQLAVKGLKGPEALLALELHLQSLRTEAAGRSA